MLRKLEVGKPIEGCIKQYQEGVKFDFDNSGAVLFIMFRDPTNQEIESIRKGRLQIGICTLSNIIFMLFKFGNLNWIDAPFDIHLAQNQSFLNVEMNESQGFGMSMFLVDASTGILQAMRLIGWPHRLSQIFIEEAKKQVEQAFEQSEYDRKIDAVYMKYSTNDLVRFGQIFRLEGGL